MNLRFTDVVVNVAFAISTDEAPLENRESSFASVTATRSHIPLFFAEICDVIVAESIISERLEYAIIERDILFHAMNDIKESFQMVSHEPRVVQIEKDSLNKKGRVAQVKLGAARAERGSLQVPIENRAMSSEKKKRKEEIDCLSSLEVKYVAIASTILKAIPRMSALEISKLDPFQGTRKRRLNRRKKLVSTQGIVLFKEVSIAALARHFHISSRKLFTPSCKNDV